MKKLWIILSFSPLIVYGQQAKEKDYESGKLQIGMRTTLSLFSDDGSPGTGIGGDFRLKFDSRLNSEWFFDYITTDIGKLAHRTDYHIGWSVIYYPFNKEIKEGKFTPYIAAGHCFDYTEVRKNAVIGFSKHRLSSAIQTGMGVHYNITDNFDVSLKSQYMLHFGNEIHAEIFTTPDGYEDVLIVEEGNLGMEGHLLLTLSVNVYIADLWGRKPKQ